jgi:hypothetical protein
MLNEVTYIVFVVGHGWKNGELSRGTNGTAAKLIKMFDYQRTRKCRFLRKRGSMFGLLAK